MNHQTRPVGPPECIYGAFAYLFLFLLSASGTRRLRHPACCSLCGKRNLLRFIALIRVTPRPTQRYSCPRHVSRDSVCTVAKVSCLSGESPVEPPVLSSAAASLSRSFSLAGTKASPSLPSISCNYATCFNYSNSIPVF